VVVPILKTTLADRMLIPRHKRFLYAEIEWGPGIPRASPESALGLQPKVFCRVATWTCGQLKFGGGSSRSAGKFNMVICAY
jgi:hypothetical protein